MIQEYRKNNKYTQEQMAEKLKISLRQYQRIDKEEFMPRKYTLLKIFEILNIPIHEQKEYIYSMWLKRKVD